MKADGHPPHSQSRTLECESRYIAMSSAGFPHVSCFAASWRLFVAECVDGVEF